MLDLRLDALMAVRGAVANAGLKWNHSIRDAIRCSELSTNLWICDRERFDLILESELTYFTDNDSSSTDDGLKLAETTIIQE